MGLAGQKKRTKLSQDPNNTAWSKSTDGFGHKMLSKQGWKPGDFLGAEDAGHAEHYTAANASHIKVFLREDNLGLGAKLGKSNAETFGLSLFSGVLGRLNGKTDAEVQKQQDTLQAAELRMYQANKYGFMNFVRGGLLVGDKMEEPGSEGAPEADTQTPAKRIKLEHTIDDASDILSKPKKRKSRSDEHEAAGNAEEAKMSQETKSAKPRRADLSVPESAAASTASGDISDTRERKQRKKKRRDVSGDEAPSASAASSSKEEKRRAKAERKAHKEERRRRKEMRRNEKAAAKATSSDSDEVGNAVTPQPINPAVAMFNGSRHAVRQRYIQQKRMASMDAQAVREIFMLKGAA